MPLLLLLQSSGPPTITPIGPPIVPGNVTSSLTFQDAFGSPLPPRTQVDILNAADPAGTAPFATGFVGMTSSFATPLEASGQYRVEYSGQAAPTIPTFFNAGPVGSNNTIVPDYYVSPWALLPGWADRTGRFMTAGRTAQAALHPGGGMRVYLEMISSCIAQMDVFTRTVSAGQRLISSRAGQITSWVTDFLGTVLPPLAGEADTAYIGRIEAWIQQAFTTLPAIQDVVDTYFKQFIAPISGALVIDRQSDPVRSAFYGVTAGQIAIILYAEVGTIGSWYLGQQYFLGQNSFLEGATTDAGFTVSQMSPYPILAQRVNACKAAGIVPVYVASIGGP